MKKILITGASGFVGGYLAEHLLSQNTSDITGTYFTKESLEISPVKGKIEFLQVNLQNRSEVYTLLEKTKPDWIFHLAAAASVASSFKDPIGTFHANIDSQLNLLESLRELNLLQTKVLIVGSAEEYGYVQATEIPINENTPLRPANPYSVSKVAQDFLALQYYLSYKLPLVRVRPFNHVGPRQGLGYVLSDFAKQIADIEQGKQKPVITVGNLEAKRDFTDVRDMVKAYPLLLEKGISGDVYNIGSGISHKIQEILDLLISFSTVKITTEVNPAKLRPSDVPEIVSDNTKVMEVTKWQPEIPFEKTIKDTLDYWRNIR